jgi:hypothetical protein
MIIKNNDHPQIEINSDDPMNKKFILLDISTLYC